MRRYTEANHLMVGHIVSNAMFHFEKEAPILEIALKYFNKAFNAQIWASGGPNLLQRCLLSICGFSPDVPVDGVMMTRERFSRERCQGVTVLDYKSFFPYGWMQHESLLKQKTRTDWYEILDQSYAVHFYHSSSLRHGNGNIIKRPKYYGAKKPAYLVLALDHCPISYWSKTEF